jgi:hypothetical protein
MSMTPNKAGSRLIAAKRLDPIGGRHKSVKRYPAALPACCRWIDPSTAIQDFACAG